MASNYCFLLILRVLFFVEPVDAVRKVVLLIQCIDSIAVAIAGFDWRRYDTREKHHQILKIHLRQAEIGER